MKDVIGIGALNMDLMYEVDDLAALRKEGWPLSAGRETSIPPEEFRRLLKVLDQRGTLRWRSGGGSAANTIVALARMGFATGFVGRVGIDEEGAFLLKEMEGVDLAQVKAGGRSGTCLVVLDHRRDRALLVQPYANDDLGFKDFDLSYLSQSRYLHLSAFVGDRPFDAQRRLMEFLPSEVRVSLDPGDLYAKRGREAILPLIERATTLFATASEISAVTGENDYKAGCREIASLGPETVVCKRGEEGAYCFSKEGEVNFRPHGETAVVDNTGAGDVFDAGFLAGVLLGRPMDRCLAFAHHVAAKSLAGYGRGHYPGADDLTGLKGG
jgi:sugar/nucleoside kinase (ribokinase family)